MKMREANMVPHKSSCFLFAQWCRRKTYNIWLVRLHTNTFYHSDLILHTQRHIAWCLANLGENQSDAERRKLLHTQRRRCALLRRIIISRIAQVRTIGKGANTVEVWQETFHAVRYVAETMSLKSKDMSRIVDTHGYPFRWEDPETYEDSLLFPMDRSSFRKCVPRVLQVGP